VAELLAGFGSYPPYFLRLRERNRAGPELLGSDWRVLPLLSADRVREHVPGGGVLVDARPITAFAARWAARPGRPVTVMCGHGERAMTAASLLARAGHKDLRVAHGGPQDWQRATGQALARS
jgi:rhodanese-related sulfurtransferase